MNANMKRMGHSSQDDDELIPRVTFYELGFHTQTLMLDVDTYWHIASEDSQAGRLKSSLGDVLVHVDAAAHYLESQPLEREIRTVGLLSEVGWGGVLCDWLGPHHLDVIRREDPHELPEHWWKTATPLTRPPFAALANTLTCLESALPTPLGRFLSAGRLVAQVLALSYNNIEHAPWRGDRFPLPKLRATFQSLASDFPTLLDLHLPTFSRPLAGCCKSAFTNEAVVLWGRSF